MMWAFWATLLLLVLLCAGWAWMRNRPVRDADGNVLDEYGRVVKPIDQLARRIMHVIMREHNKPMSIYDIRCIITTSRQQMHAALEYLRSRGLLEVIKLDPTRNFVCYRLTDHGVVEVQLPQRTQRGRHRS